MRLREFTDDTVANWRTIADRNNIDNPNKIMPGQVLDVGDGIVLPKGTTYTVKPGDTLTGIAQTIRKTGSLPDTASVPSSSASATKSSPPVSTKSTADTSPYVAPVDDDEIKRRIGADQPIPGYKLDPSKDQAVLDKLEKQDRERQKKMQQQDQEIKKNFPKRYNKKYAPSTGK
jgi:nucleoid-associated protein YgaU